MTEEEIEIFAKYSLIDSLKSGCTTTVAIGLVNSLGEERAVALIDEMGVRSCLGWVFRNGVHERTQAANVETRWLEPDVGPELLEKAAGFVDKYRGALDGRVIPMFFPSQVDTCSADLLRAIRKKADELKAGISIHAGQYMFEFQNMLRMYGRTPVEFLNDTGLLGPDVIIGHLWAIAGHPMVAYPPEGGGDLKILAETGTTVSHDPVVFVWRGNKMHSHTKYRKAGVNVSIGTDFAPQDMLNQMRVASYVTKLADWDCYSGSSREIFTSATLGGAKAIGRSDLGRIAPGALADVAIVSMESLNTVPVRDPIKNLVNHANRSDVKTVIVDGKILVKDGEALNVDEAELVKKVQAISERRWNSVAKNDPEHRTIDHFSPQSFKPWEE
jgi:cytosine/adenosine deaminase-related metal-dependent hydrolase